MPEGFSPSKSEGMLTLKPNKQIAGDHEESLSTAIKNNIRPIREISEIKEEIKSVKQSARRLADVYSPIYKPVLRYFTHIPCGIANVISKTICKPNNLIGKIFHPGGTFSPVKKILGRVAGFPCHLSQSSANVVCHPQKTFSKIMNKVHRGGKIRNCEGGAGAVFEYIYNNQSQKWYTIDSKRGRYTLIMYLTYAIEDEN